MKSKEVPVGARFTRWVVLSTCYKGPCGGREFFSDCVCDCGALKTIRTLNLLNKQSMSCGCFSRETASKRMREKATNISKIPGYAAWNQMIKRCHDPSHQNYYRYGARGISVCKRWRESIQAFYEDVGPRPASGLSTLDRIDNNKGYEPGNVRWADFRTQNNNRRDNILVEIDGVRMTLGQAIERAGSVTKNKVARERMIRHGWTAKKAVSEPTGKMGGHRVAKSS